MASYIDIAHQWANQDFGNNGSLKAGNCSCNKLNFYSFNTVIAQWLDLDKKVMAVIDVYLTPTTTRHINVVKSAIPHDVNIFYCHQPDPYGLYHNVNFVSYQRGRFDKKVRMQMVDILIDNLYEQFATIPHSRSLCDGNISLQYWADILKLNELYNHDASPQKWLKQKIGDHVSKEKRALITKKRKMVRGLLHHASNQEIVDTMFGVGTWKAYQDRTAGLRKTQHDRELAGKINDYMLLNRFCDSHYTYKQIMAMTPSQRMQIKFNNLEKRSESFKRMHDHKNNSIERAKRYIGVYTANSFSGVCSTVTNRFTGKIIYYFERPSYLYDYDENIEVKFGASEFNSFCKASNKTHWIKRFYDICMVKRNRIVAMNIYNDIKSKKRTLDDLCPAEIALYDAYLKRKEKHKLHRDKIKAETELKLAREREEKLQKIAQYRENGIEGLRDMWRNHLAPIPQECWNNNEYYYGGNVLLRFEKDNTVGTSKGVKLSIKLCKSLFKSIRKWHENPTQFSPIEIKTQNCGTFRVTNYQDDILVAGCHEIAYAEMERMHNEILKINQA